MLFGGIFLLGFLSVLIASTVVVLVLLFVNRSNARRWPRVMGRAQEYLFAIYPNQAVAWNRDQWETAISATSGDRYVSLLDKPQATSPTRSVRQGPWWAVAAFAVIWALVGAWILNAALSGRPIDRSELIGVWTGHGNASQGAVVVELRGDGTYTASGFRFPAELDHTGTWTLFNFAGDPKVDLNGRTFGDNIDVVWEYFQPTISACNGDPDGSTNCTTLTKIH